MTMTWNLRMAAAQRDVWKASQLHAIARRRRVAAAKHSTSSIPVGTCVTSAGAWPSRSARACVDRAASRPHRPARTTSSPSTTYPWRRSPGQQLFFADLGGPNATRRATVASPGLSRAN